jgi:hypothetical protein
VIRTGLARAQVLTTVLIAACGGADDASSPCTDCQIAIEPVAAFGAADGNAALPGMVRTIVRDSRGRLLVGAFNADRVLVFDTTGQLDTTFGRKGEGPGEFGGGIPIIVRSRGDSIVVYDGGNDRLAAFSGEFEPGWTAADITTFGGGSLVALRDGGFVRSGESGRGANRSRAPLHLLDTEGRLVRSFGADSADPTAPGTMYPTLAATSDGQVWAANRSRYRLILWSTDGTPIRTIERSVEWFPSRASSAAVTPDQAPVPAIDAIHLDDEGRLWVFIEVGAPDWSDGLGPAEDGAHGIRYPVTDPELVYETVIEVLDATTGELLASTRVPQRIGIVVDDGLAASDFEDSTGVPRVQLMRLTLRND